MDNELFNLPKEYPSGYTKACSKCGLRKGYKDFPKNRYQNSGLQTYCKKCRREFRATVGKHSIDKYKKTVGRYSEVRLSASRRKIPFALTKEQFHDLVIQKCHYCQGDLPLWRSGLDRIDNDKGYEVGNVLPCCSWCNMARGSWFTVSEMERFVGPAIRQIRDERIRLNVPQEFRLFRRKKDVAPL